MILHKLKGVVKRELSKLPRLLNLRRQEVLRHQADNQEFEYSAEWYDSAYHIGRVGVDRRTFNDVRKQYEHAGYHRRLGSVLDQIHVPDTPLKWLEVGCHLGLTACWIAERYPQVQLYMMDFSEQSILWCQKWFPYQERATIWRASVESIRLPDLSLDEVFDFATCLDVTEHLPDEVYRKMIKELWRVLTPEGHLILMQGDAPNVEHIHVLPEEELVSDFVSDGFKLIKKLPSRHYLLQKVPRKE